MRNKRFLISTVMLVIGVLVLVNYILKAFINPSYVAVIRHRINIGRANEIMKKHCTSYPGFHGEECSDARRNFEFAVQELVALGYLSRTNIILHHLDLDNPEWYELGEALTGYCKSINFGPMSFELSSNTVFIIDKENRFSEWRRIVDRYDISVEPIQRDSL